MTLRQSSRINDALYAIHKDIASPLCARQLAAVASYSEQHFHRVFKQYVGESVNKYIRRVRLEQAANLLTFDSSTAIADITEKCGYVSLSSFTQAFKCHFGVTPGRWRAGEAHSGSAAWLTDPEITQAYRAIAPQPLPRPQLIVREPQPVAYVRHRGYGRSIGVAWNVLKAWALETGHSFAQQFGLHHSNPAWVPLADCRYVACIAVDAPPLRRSVVNSLTIPGGLHATFKLQGRYGDLLPWISKIMQQWLPESGLKLGTTPSFVHYHKNHFLLPEEEFDLTFYLPVGLG